MIKSIANNFLFCFIYLARDWSLAKIAREKSLHLFCFVLFFVIPTLQKRF